MATQQQPNEQQFNKEYPPQESTFKKNQPNTAEQNKKANVPPASQPSKKADDMTPSKMSEEESKVYQAEQYGDELDYVDEQPTHANDLYKETLPPDTRFIS